MDDEKKSLIVRICEKLNEKNFTDTDCFGGKGRFSAEYAFGAKLHYLPEDNLLEILRFPMDGYADFSALFKAWESTGVLYFKPYIIDEDDNPTLVLEVNRYLHMFRGYHFQISGSADGIEDCGSGIYSTNFFTYASHYQFILKNGLITYLLWWAALIDVGFRNERFIQVFNEDLDLIDRFLTASIHYWGGPDKYHWSDIKKYMTVGKGTIDIDSRKVYALENKKGDIQAYAAMGLKTVQVETLDNLLTVTIPDLNADDVYNLSDEDAAESYTCDVHILESNHFREMLLVMALALSGICINFMGHYCTRPIESINTRLLADEDITLINSLNDLYNTTPDKY